MLGKSEPTDNSSAKGQHWSSKLGFAYESRVLHSKNAMTSWALWLMPIIQVTWKEETGRMVFQAIPGKKLVRPHLKKQAG
jgi:hypothetical protein